MQGLQSLHVILSINALLPISDKNQPICHIWISNIHPPYQLACHCPLRVQFNHLWWKCSWDTMKWKWKSVFQLYLNLHSQCLGKFQWVMKMCWCKSFLNIQHFSNTGTNCVVGTWTEFKSLTLSTFSLTVFVTLTPSTSSSIWSDSSLVIPASGSTLCEQFGFLD